MAFFCEAALAASQSVKFTIPGHLPGLNDMTDAARRNRYESAKMKREYTDLVAWCAKSARLPRFDQVDMVITWYEPNQKRDKDNIMAGQKFILDGLVQAGVLSNDGWKQIGKVTHDFKIDRQNPRVEVELKEIKAS
jgi:Holliday junction resolvase RusA-like endonuclease